MSLQAFPTWKAFIDTAQPVSSGKHDVILTVLVVEHGQREGHLHVLQLKFLSVFSRFPEVQGGVCDALSSGVTIGKIRAVTSPPWRRTLDGHVVQLFILLDLVKESKSTAVFLLNGRGAHISNLYLPPS